MWTTENVGKKKGRNPLCRSRVCVKKIMHMQIEKKRPQPAYMWKSHMKNAYAKHECICETYATENGRLFDSKMIAYASKNIHIHD